MSTPQPPWSAQGPYPPRPGEASWPRPAGGAGWYGHAPPPPVQGTNGFAIASLVLGVLWLYWLGSLLAVVFGHVALRQIRRSNGWQQGRGLALAGVILGWVGIGILAAVIVVGVAVADDAESTEGGVSTGDAGASVSDMTAPEGTPSTTPATEYRDPGLATDVLARGAPEVEPPPEDTPAGALEAETLVEGEGEGEGAGAGDTLLVHYVGVLPDGTVFDQSWERGQPFPVTLGAGSVIAGWEEGLLGVEPGERRRLVIGADKAYGDQAMGQIPANSPLAFVVDVIQVS